MGSVTGVIAPVKKPSKKAIPRPGRVQLPVVHAYTVCPFFPCVFSFAPTTRTEVYVLVLVTITLPSPHRHGVTTLHHYLWLSITLQRHHGTPLWLTNRPTSFYQLGFLLILLFITVILMFIFFVEIPTPAGIFVSRYLFIYLRIVGRQPA